MLKKKQIVAIVLGSLALLVAGGWLTNWSTAYSTDYYHQVQRNIELFGRIYQEISKRYVEEVDPGKFMKAGIDGMLGVLDPYTVLVEKEDNAELVIMSSGKYGGLGMRIGLRSDLPSVIEPPFEGTPALKAGIREGDRITRVDDTPTHGLTISQVATLLRGEIGTLVKLAIAREGEDELIEFRIIRDEIVITDVMYSGVLRDGIGYIRLSGFSRNAGKDVEKAIRALKKEGLTSLILDLRSNPGGLLDAAVRVSQNFVSKGDLIVSTKGRDSKATQEFRSKKSPILEDMPLAVLVNGYSASASEIVAGAIQDLDRGVILGTKTFGKGLVQTVFPITGDTALKITTAKYLIPSGRSIQDPKRFLKDPDAILLTDDPAESDTSDEEPESENEYLTENGRRVSAGHGITPDIIVEEEPLSRFEVELLRKTMPFQFAVGYAARHPELERGFAVKQEMIADFQAFLDESDFTYTNESEVALERIAEIAEKEEYYASISAPVDDLRTLISARKAEAFRESVDFIKEELKQEISAKLWGTKEEMNAGFANDLVIQKALEVLEDQDAYRTILTPREK